MRRPVEGGTVVRLSCSVAWRRAAVVIVCVSSLALVGCMPASAADVRVRHALFGMHDATGSTSSLTQVDAGAVRLWDVGVRWREIERTRGHYRWAKLDGLVSNAQAAHAEVTMVVAGTPRFYSKDMWKLPAKHIAAYKHFVKALMKRYKNFHGSRGIAAYQVWNEANIATFWTGSYGMMARLTKAMHDIGNRVDKRALVIAPPMVTRLDYELKGLSEYYHQRVGGRPVWRYIDAVALSLYPLPKYGRRAGVPEDSIKLLGAAKKRLRQAGVPGTKPIWNTEINYGLQSGKDGGTPADPISNARQAANVMRTYLLNGANGVKRVFWYRYDWSGNLANTLLTDRADVSRLTAAGRAYVRAQERMHGTLIGGKGHPPSAKDRRGTYHCVVKDSSGKRHIYWNPYRSAKVRLPKGVHDLEGVLGSTSTVRPHSVLKVGYKPVMVH
jgi:hypothetical protein